MPDNSQPIRQEFEFINWIRQQVRVDKHLVLGIGDDAALHSIPTGKQLVTTVDVLTEGTHFTSETSPELIGRKALAVNLSDIAAMGAQPMSAFVGIVIPQHLDRKYLEAIYSGLFQLAQEFGVTVAGGDTISNVGPLTISVTLIGLVDDGQALLRSGAQPGDWLFVTGSLGGSFNSGRHLSFAPRLKESQILAEQFRPTSMLDISDGLAGDIQHLARESSVGFTIDADHIPIHSDVDSTLPFETRLQHAFNDGEDFELLFTVSPEIGKKLINEAKSLDLQVTHIGECTQTQKLLVRSGTAAKPLTTSGWGHKLQSGKADSKNVNSSTGDDG